MIHKYYMYQMYKIVRTAQYTMDKQLKKTGRIIEYFYGAEKFKIDR